MSRGLRYEASTGYGPEGCGNKQQRLHSQGGGELYRNRREVNVADFGKY